MPESSFEVTFLETAPEKNYFHCSISINAAANLVYCLIYQWTIANPVYPLFPLATLIISIGDIAISSHEHVSPFPSALATKTTSVFSRLLLGSVTFSKLSSYRMDE